MTFVITFLYAASLTTIWYFKNRKTLEKLSSSPSAFEAIETLEKIYGLKLFVVFIRP